jgi:hypothetical protein
MSRTLRMLCGLVVGLSTTLQVGGCTSDAPEQTAPATRAAEEDPAARAERIARETAANEALTKRATAGPVKDNLLANGSFEEWPAGEGPQAPAQWRLVEQETAAKLTRKTGGKDVHDGKSALAVGADVGVVSIASEGVVVSDTQNANLRGKTVTAGVWAKADTNAAAFINIRDGVDESPVVDHPGDGEWHFIAVSYTLSPEATSASVRIGNRKQDEKTTVSFDGAVLVAPAQ